MPQGRSVDNFAHLSVLQRVPKISTYETDSLASLAAGTMREKYLPSQHYCSKVLVLIGCGHVMGEEHKGRGQYILGPTQRLRSFPPASLFQCPYCIMQNKRTTTVNIKIHDKLSTQLIVHILLPALPSYHCRFAYCDTPSTPKPLVVVNTASSTWVCNPSLK